MNNALAQTNDDIDTLVAEIRSNGRYRSVCEDVLRRIVATELSKRRNKKEAVKETRSRLHQVAGAYIETPPPYSKWLATIEGSEDDTSYRMHLREIMRAHASTRERLPVLEEFYSELFAVLPPVNSILDIACGYNPLALPWMHLARESRYEAWDLFDDMTSFLSGAMQRFAQERDIRVRVAAGDVMAYPPPTSADVAFILKFVPLLEQGRFDVAEWLMKINARTLVISFPTKTLGGKSIGMINTYKDRFGETLDRIGRTSQCIQFPNEICFVVHQ